ncbi:MAG: acyltransferase family protein [Proteobacteria bacterium]|nr:acyltransferase family protein [Pseudomonadota bacterium]
MTAVNGNIIFFLDNLRTMTVLAVVLLHAACPYSNIVAWWSVREPVAGPFFDILILILGIFVMPTLFFISGYFALYSLRTRCMKGFITAKFKRLAIPLVTVGFLFVPVISYIRVLQSAEVVPSYFVFWLAQMKTLFQYPLVDYSVPEIATAHMAYFSPWHL